ncbi:MAG: PepSY-associated TM helix domain-containing protein [Planctomycetota bacterium]
MAASQTSTSSKAHAAQARPSKPRSRAPRINRQLHRFGSILTAAPLIVVIVTGIFLQLKKDWTWVQPATVRGSTEELRLSFDEVLAAAAAVPEAGITTWDDVDRLDVRPSKGMVKVRGKNRWEVQVDAVTGEVLQTSFRRSDLIESLHDGSWFGSPVKLWIFLPVALVLLGLWFTGMYLWLLPHLVRRRRRQAG